ncbi:adenylate cyclase type 10-like isoform X2 [Aricia agestis]|uniref:adenylate cyclase type 10-like isoform X2 n=1 Tax=Aricia agestis TaxID=91739 RepID=UPI001C20538B|nr:adenylate cyclase type 10-like isoform X2 [Aricia agestis]
MNFKRRSRTRSRRNSLSVVAGPEKWQKYNKKIKNDANHDSSDEDGLTASELKEWVDEFFVRKSMLEDNIDQDVEVKLTRKQTLVLSTLVPDEILLMEKFDVSSPRRFVGVLLMADVSGFTALSERYNNAGKAGTYQLTAILNTYLGSLIEVVYSYGGDIIKFAGDAFLALWKLDKRSFLCQTIHTAIACSLVIQHAYGSFETDAKVNLKVKLAIAAGNLIFSPIGAGSEMNYVLFGLPVLEAKKAESLCASGEVKLTPTAWGHCYSRNYVHHVDDQGYITIKAILYDPHETNVTKPFLDFPAMLRRVNKPQTMLNDLSDSLFEPSKKMSNIEIIKRKEFLSLRKTILLGEERNIGSQIRKFMIRPVLTQIDAHQPLEYLTEMRQVSVMFVTLKPKDCPFSQVINIVHNSYKITCELVYKSMGCVNKIILFDKDVMILVIFGLRGFKHESEAQATLKCSYNIKKLLTALDGVLEVSIGVTTGKVYCGVVGHPLRREFTVIGAAVNRAARFMCTYRNKITCDEATYLNSKLSGNGFTVQPSITMKGIIHPGKIYEYNEDIRLKQMFDIAIIPPLLNREDEMDYFKSWLNSNTRTYRDFDALLLIGESRVGKTRLLEWMLRYAKNNEIITCCVSLTSIHASTPYLAVSQIVNQLLGLKEPLSEFEKEKKIINILSYYSEDLCYLNEVLKVRFAYHERSSDISEETRLEKAKYIFSTILKSLPHTYAIFIDDLQNLDDLSWEFISLLLDDIKIYSVLTVTRGKFQAMKSWFYAVYMKNNIRKMVLKPLDKQWIPSLACQILDVNGVPNELCDALRSKCNGMPGQVETFLMHLFSCGALDLKRINKEELPSYNEELHFPKPAQIQFVALDSKDQPSLDQARSENQSDQVSVCILKNKDDLNTELNEINLDALIMIQLDSLAPYQQLLLKIASVIGNIFSRDLLESIMYENDPTATAKAIKRLFSMRIISCANIKRKQHITFRESTPLGSFKESPTCECGFEYDPDQNEGLPKYAFCKVMKFKNKNSRKTFYELLPLNQKKDFHTRIVNHLENKKHKCHSCGGSITIVQSITGLECLKIDSSSLIKETNCDSAKENKILNASSNNAMVLKTPNLTTNRDDVTSNEKKHCWVDNNLMFVNIRHVLEAKTTNDWESIGIIESEDNLNENKNNFIPPGLKLERGVSRTDFKACSCAELNITVSEQLIFHSREAQIKMKVVDFLIKYSYLNLLAHISNSKVIVKLNEAESICIDKSVNYLSKCQRKLYLGKIYTLKANANLLADKLMAAKIDIDKAMRIYGFDVNKVRKILNFRSIISHIKLRHGKYRNQADERRSDSIMCFNVATALYSAINDGTSAKAAAQRALYLSQTVKCNVIDLCNAFYNFIELELPGLANTNLRLDKLTYMTLSMIPNAIQSEELYAVGKLFMALFTAYTARANIPVAIRYGYQALALSQFLYVVHISIDIIPNLFYLLLSRCRIKEAVEVVEILLQIGCPEEWFECQIWYHALCMDFILDAGLQIETPEMIDDFTELSLQKRKFSGPCRRRLILNLWTYWLRTDESKAKRFENEALTIMSRQTEDSSLKTLMSSMRLAEGMLESLARKVGDLSGGLNGATFAG